MGSTVQRSGYSLQVLRAGGEFTLYRGQQAGRPSILAVAAAADEPSTQSLERLKHELGLAGDLDPVWAVQPSALVNHEGRPMLLLEDSGGEPLDLILERAQGKPLELTYFLQLASDLARALGQVHARGLIHKDIKPANVLVDEAGQVRLMGFGIASRLRSESQTPGSPELIAGTLPYMAPEQTGRMNRSMDARSDLYSLGITLYELCTASLPFSASDPMEWIHCHIARQPLPPSQRVGGLPGVIDAIILKLLAKNPEDRYKTAGGVEADLRRALAYWKAHASIEVFVVGEHDVLDRPMITEKLYGRDAEMAVLLDASQRVMTHGTTEMVLVSGYAGIGKSSIVNELHTVVGRGVGLFAAGKFDQYKRDIPYATLAQAFQSLVRQLLSKSEAELSRWRDELLAALGSNGQLMVNLIPELAHMIGEQPPIPQVDPQSAQTRFHLVFRSLLGVFAKAEHPLVLFIDDLQWLDTGTLELLERLVTDPEVRHLMVVGAYRDNEVNQAHPLARTVEAIRRAGVAISEITLGPLKVGHVAQLAADALHTGIGRTRQLAELVCEKTAGNPFFAVQFITALADEGLLTFHSESSSWQWDIGRIRAKGITDNVADLMSAKLSRLSPETRETLGQLACLGNVADVRALALIRETSQDHVHAILQDAVDAGLILHMNGSFSFLHDRVQEAGYALIPQPERAMAHLRIGRVLLALTPPMELEGKIFDIVNQFERGASAIASASERDTVAGLYLVAGKRAKTSSAYAAAQAYFAAGRALLGDGSWVDHYALTFSLERHRAECEIVRGEMAVADDRLATLAMHAASLADQAEIVCLAVLLYFTTNRNERAVEVALAFLSRVGIVWTAHPSEAEARQEYLEMRRRLIASPMQTVGDLPAMSDPACIAAMAVLTELFPAAYAFDRYLLELVLLRMTNLSLEHGNCESSSVAYSALNMALGCHFADYATAYSLGQVACELAERRGMDRYKARVYCCFTAFAMPWIKPLSLCLPLLAESIRGASSMGDTAFAAYASRNMLTHLLVSGMPLGQVQREAEQTFAFANGIELGMATERFIRQLDLIRRLRGVPSEDRPDDAEWASQEIDQHPGLAMMVCYYWVFTLEERFFALDFAAALEAAAHVQGRLWAMRSTIEEAEYDFFAALTRAAAIDRSPAEQRERHYQALLGHYQRIVVWADNCPENFANRKALVGAEIARIEGREIDAQSLYEEAIHLARNQGFVQNEGLANELAGQLYARRGLDTVADAYLRKARSCYERWGAISKVKQLDARYPQLRAPAVAGFLNATIDAPVAQLDVKTVDKASQTLSSEMVLPSLLEKLMRLAVEHAGATKGTLVLLHDDGLYIEAEATTGSGRVEVTVRRARVAPSDLPQSALQYVLRTREHLVLDDALAEGLDPDDEYVRRSRCRSILCLPVFKQENLVGALYLENNLATCAFTPDRVAVLDFLASQAAISLENARLYSDLQRSEAFLVEGQSISHTGSFAWNTVSGKISWSAEMFSIFEYPTHVTPTVAMVMQRVHPEDVPLVTQHIERASSDGQDFAYEFRLRMDDGRLKYAGVAAHASKDELGNVQFVGAVMDVTERRLAEVDRERLGERLRQVEKMEAIGRLAGGIAHDFNNVLGGIIAYGEMLFDEAPSDSIRKRHAQNVLTAANRGRALVEQILAYSRSQRSKRTPINVGRTVTETLELVRGSLPSTIRLDLSVPDRAFTIVGDATQLHQVVMNLCSNAIHAMGDSGTLRVALTVEDVDANRELSHGKLRAGNYVGLTVKDSGCGMDEATLSRIFEPFFTTKEIGRGTGLGLSLVESIVTELEGAIDVSSAPGRGSSFRAYLPLAKGAVSALI